MMQNRTFHTVIVRIVRNIFILKLVNTRYATGWQYCDKQTVPTRSLFFERKTSIEVYIYKPIYYIFIYYLFHNKNSKYYITYVEKLPN